MHVITVCIRQDVPLEKTVHAAKAAYIAGIALVAKAAVVHSPDSSQIVTHFVHNAHRRSRGELIAPREHMAAGGPVQLLNLDWMAHLGFHGNLRRWQVWNQVVHGTPVAQPLWRFVDRHRSTPKKGYSLDQAHRDYRAQPRVAAMEIYNRSGRAVMQLPLHHLEAFQVGRDAYAELGFNTAVPANAIVSLDGVLRECRPSEPLSQVWEFISAARSALSQLSFGDRLVALAVD
ncbi:hypothetical protein [Catellatospora chokoriensis]|uniref:Uncharacterized protein n=1 Tax=Catellatospora chokoriensis TaxID=310353 RepID=A0A8J3K6G0_9ACTN|nr:hypothetical protein [Catellatospora chokoriensis]GIF94036.1 hypothetical protein Cch02nite_74800 [Catellatospora chokoriensis]